MKYLRSIYSLLVIFGIDPVKAILSIRAAPCYWADFKKLKSQKKSAVREFPFARPFPCFEDQYKESGAVKGHYFHQDLLVARRIHANNPIAHFDVGSRVDGLIAHVASFRIINVLDFRPLYSNIPNVRFMQADFMSPISDTLIDSCDSLSCLHALEHFGLGRYGDPINYDGYVLGLVNLYKVLKKGGKFYLSVPIGPQRIEFHAHRVFSIGYLLELINGKYRIDHFSYIDDDGNLHENEIFTDDDINRNFGCIYGCGIFEMTKC